MPKPAPPARTFPLVIITLVICLVSPLEVPFKKTVRLRLRFGWEACLACGLAGSPFRSHFKFFRHLLTSKFWPMGCTRENRRKTWNGRRAGSSPRISLGSDRHAAQQLMSLITNPRHQKPGRLTGVETLRQCSSANMAPQTLDA